MYPANSSLENCRMASSNGYHPIYVDLTCEDLRIPVVKAIVPGMELSADFERSSRVSPRLFSNYLRDLNR
jgi:ribosomal protein S12 methylthiotransferase accessory factor YcaO